MINTSELVAFERLYVAFSGGLDSSVLLHWLANSELSPKIQAIHINHGLSPNADAWEAHCRQVCEDYKLPLLVKKLGLERGANLEAVARNHRYAIFKAVLEAGDALLLAHHQDDQAETVLLQLFRGAGVGGLSAMSLAKPFAKAKLIRPLLEHSRKSLEAYAEKHALSWVEDESNVDTRYSRNFVRHELIPLIESRWGSVRTNLARTAKHCLDASAHLQALAEIDCPGQSLMQPLALAGLKSLTAARMNNVLQSWLKNNGLPLPNTATFERLLSEVIFGAEDKNPELVLGKYRIRRYQEVLYIFALEEELVLQTVPWPLFPKPLSLPANLGTLCAISASDTVEMPKPGCISIRFRQNGETIRLGGQTKSLKKLLQSWKVPPWQRGLIPLLYWDEVLMQVVGYAISDAFKKSGWIIKYLDCANYLQL